MAASRSVAIATGASIGNVRATGFHLAARGWLVVLVARRACELDELKELIRSRGGTAISAPPPAPWGSSRQKETALSGPIPECARTHIRLNTACPSFGAIRVPRGTIVSS